MEQPTFKSISLRLLKYFMNGLLLMSPLAITGYVVYWVITTLDGWLDLSIPGLGLLITLAGITLVGFVGSGLLIGPILSFIEKLLTRAPFIKLIYTSIKDLMEAFVGDKRKFNQPVMVKLSDGTFKPGFLTQEDLSQLGYPGFVAVYLPHSYNFSGNIFVVAAEAVKKVDVNATEYMKFIVSGGVTHFN
jgi:uncharacterized membrane protein